MRERLPDRFRVSVRDGEHAHVATAADEYTALVQLAEQLGFDLRE